MKSLRLATLILISPLALAGVSSIQGPKEDNEAHLLSPKVEADALEADRDLRFTSSNLGKFKITVHNIAFQQPMSRFFASVHSSSAEPLYTFGQPPSEALALLAENGDPEPLVDLYKSMGASMLAAGIVTDGALEVGKPRSFTVTTTSSAPYVSFASMAINTNDCFVGVTGILLWHGQELLLPGLDAGSEENNELCKSIPGPACANIDTDNVRSGKGEGFVHVHRGFFGIGTDLSQVGYDWRNPMLKVEVQRIL